jgi:hypothetical protein
MTPNFEVMSNAELRAYARQHREDVTALRVLFSRSAPDAPTYNFPNTEEGFAQTQAVILQKIAELDSAHRSMDGSVGN